MEVKVFTKSFLVSNAFVFIFTLDGDNVSGISFKEFKGDRTYTVNLNENQIAFVIRRV